MSRRRSFILGGAHTQFLGKGHPDFIWKRHPDFGSRENPTLEETITSAVDAALTETGVDPAQIERGYIGNFTGELFNQQGHLGAALAGSNPAFEHKPFMRVEGACASGGLALVAATDAIRAGCDVVLVTGAEVQTTVNARVGADYLARAAHYRRQRDIDEFTFPALFARRIKACTDAWGITSEDRGLIAKKAYDNANANPYAHMHARQVTLEWAVGPNEKNPRFLGNPELNAHLTMSDCSQVSDGGSALVLVSEEGLAKLGRQPSDAIELVEYGVATASLYADSDPLRLSTTRAAATKVYEASGLTPKEVQIAEVHDCFTIAELLMYEAIGLAAEGDGKSLARSGATRMDGRIPVNTGGGLIGFGHPVGATGVKQAIEIHRQMKGICGDYQMAQTPGIGLSANMGGDDRTVVVGLYRNVE
jgi:acetyl-CoA acyltransferase